KKLPCARRRVGLARGQLVAPQVSAQIGGIVFIYTYKRKIDFTYSGVVSRLTFAKVHFKYHCAVTDLRQKDLSNHGGDAGKSGQNTADR
ncbi:hypothetical protein, partial [Pseudorhodobacter sp.]|uniref:hypothetical protein n=1 Tax=Pseudorhodobacter sp. TaxID=1934400 RepID=UPI002AFF64F5